MSTMEKLLKEARKLAKIWLMKNNKKKQQITYKWLKDKLAEKYCIREFDENDKILDELSLLVYAKNKDGFCFDDKNGMIYIFIRKSSILECGLFVLLHELGHILFCHMSNDDDLMGNAPSENVQANYFASMVLHYSNLNLVNQLKPAYKILAISIMVSIALYITFPYFQNSLPREKAESINANLEIETNVDIIQNEVYYLESNNYGAYHVFQDCRYLKNRTNVEKGTLQDAENSRKTSLCKLCKGRLNNDK